MSDIVFDEVEAPPTELAPATNQLAKIIESSGLELDTVSEMHRVFDPLFAEFVAAELAAKEINVTSEHQTAEIERAAVARKRIAKVRTTTENRRKALKADALAKGKAIDTVANFIKALVEPIESKLLAMEELPERERAKRKAELLASRRTALAPFAMQFEPAGLDEMSEAVFAQLVSDQQNLLNQRIAAAKEAERVAAEMKLAEERRQEQARIELAELRRQTALKDAELAAERARNEKERQAVEEAARITAKAAADKLAQERAEASARLMAEKKARLEAEAAVREQEAAKQAELKAIEDAKRKAAGASDKVKLDALRQAVLEITIPQFADAQLFKSMTITRDQFVQEIESAAKCL